MNVFSIIRLILIAALLSAVAVGSGYGVWSYLKTQKSEGADVQIQTAEETAIIPASQDVAIDLTQQVNASMQESLSDNAAPAEPWAYVCNEETQVCQIHQSVFATETGARILTVVIRQQQNADGLLLILSFPHGVYLPAGAKLSSDGAVFATLPFAASEEVGPYVSTDFTPALREAFDSSTSLIVDVQDTNGQVFSIPITVAQFNSAYEKLKQRDAN